MKKIFFAAVLFTWHTAGAQQPTSMDEITVTATRFPENSKAIGKIITIITAEDIKKQGAKDVAQILNAQPGIIVNGAGSNPGKDKALYMNGANYGYTLVLIDGIPLTDPSGIGGTFDLRLLPTSQIEKIEIIKGAQSTLYGADAVAGVINIITKKETGKPASLYGQLAYGSLATVKGNAGLSGQLGNTSYNVGFAHQQTKGISEAVDEKNTGIRNGYQSDAAHINMALPLAQNIKIAPFLRYVNYTGSIPEDAYMPGHYPFHARVLSTGAKAAYTAGKAMLEAAYSYDKIKRDYTSAYGNSSFEGYKNTAELLGNYHILPALSVTGGMRHDRYSMVTDNGNNTSVTVFSPYISFLYNHANGLSAALGARLNHHSRYGNNFTYNFNPAYLIANSVKVFFNYGTAFRTPTLNELYGKYGANPALQPETSHNMETGVQYYFNKNSNNSLTAYYFSRDIKNIITYNNNNTYINYNRQQDHGIEVAANAKLPYHIDLRVYYNYADGRVTINNNGKDTTYNNLFKRPKHSGGAHLSWQGFNNFYAALDYKYLSTRYDRFADPRNSYKTTTNKLSPYGLMDAYFSYNFIKNKQCTIFAQVLNIFNTAYTESSGYATPGRQGTVGIQWNW